MSKYNIHVDLFGTYYYLNNELHREDGPAIEYFNGDKEWFIHDRLHRDDGPAIDYVVGIKRWFKNGKPHREDGPAGIFPKIHPLLRKEGNYVISSYASWAFEGIFYGYDDDFTNESWKRFVQTLIFS